MSEPAVLGPDKPRSWVPMPKPAVPEPAVPAPRLPGVSRVPLPEVAPEPRENPSRARAHLHDDPPSRIGDIHTIYRRSIDGKEGQPK
jgi:hypothetical protein